MSNVPSDLRYSKTHEWARLLDDGTIQIGISDHAQELLGDMVFVELPEVGRSMKAGDECGVVESVKAASDIYAPLAGEIVEVNDSLADQPEAINRDPYGEGWLFKLRPASPADLDTLLAAGAYRELIESEEA
jgi:glycine cleavage system H protein